MIQVAMPGEYSVPDAPCECKTLELDDQPDTATHTQVNHGDFVGFGSSGEETEDSNNDNGSMQTGFCTDGLVEPSHQQSDDLLPVDIG